MHKQWFNLCMSILLAIMLKELSRHASCDICRNQSEFTDYYLVYYNYADNLSIIYPADNLLSYTSCFKINTILYAMLCGP